MPAAAVRAVASVPPVRRRRRRRDYAQFTETELQNIGDQPFRLNDIVVPVAQAMIANGTQAIDVRSLRPRVHRVVMQTRDEYGDRAYESYPAGTPGSRDHVWRRVRAMDESELRSVVRYRRRVHVNGNVRRRDFLREIVRLLDSGAASTVEEAWRLAKGE